MSIRRNNYCLFYSLICVCFLSAVIDVASGEYGHEYIDKMISLVDNGRCFNWTPYDAITENNYRIEKITGQLFDELEEEINPMHLRARSSSWEQFRTLYKRRTVQMWRDSVGMEFPLKQRELKQNKTNMER